MLRVSLASPNGWPQVVAVLSALTPHGKELVVSAGGARVRLGSKPKEITVRLISQLTAIPKGSRLRLTIAASSTAQSSGNLLYLTGRSPLVAARRGPGAPERTADGEADIPLSLLTRISRARLTRGAILRLMHVNSEERKPLMSRLIRLGLVAAGVLVSLAFTGSALASYAPVSYTHLTLPTNSRV